MKLFCFFITAFFALIGRSILQTSTMQRIAAVLVLSISLAPLPYLERSAFADTQSELLPVLQGQTAIDYLTTRGLFDELTAALAASRVDQPAYEAFNFAIAMGGETAYAPT